MIFAYILFVIFFIVGLYVLAIGIKGISDASRFRSFVELEAEIVSLSVGKDIIDLESVSSNIENFKIVYNYPYLGYIYKNDKIGFVEERIQNSKKETETNEISTVYINDIDSFIRRIRINRKIKVWINPKSPEESIIFFKMGSIYTHLFFGLVFIVFTILFVLTNYASNNSSFSESVEIISRHNSE